VILPLTVNFDGEIEFILLSHDLQQSPTPISSHSDRSPSCIGPGSDMSITPRICSAQLTSWQLPRNNAIKNFRAHGSRRPALTRMSSVKCEIPPRSQGSSCSIEILILRDTKSMERRYVLNVAKLCVHVRDNNIELNSFYLHRPAPVEPPTPRRSFHLVLRRP
jgi:hypothetical protein